MNDDIRNEMDRMNGMRLPELQAYYEEILGEETRAPNKTFLIRKILAVLEARAAGQAVDTGEEGSDESSRNEDEATGACETEDPGETVEAEDVEEPQTESLEESADFEKEQSDVPEEACCEDEQSQEPEEGDSEDSDLELQDEPGADESPSPRLRDLNVEQLQQRYLEVVGRQTGSRHIGYLKWKIRQAERGLVPVGPRRPRGTANPQDFKVLPLRIKTSAVQQMDEAWKRLGLKSRTELFKNAIGAYLEENGEGEVADLFVGTEGR